MATEKWEQYDPTANSNESDGIPPKTPPSRTRRRVTITSRSTFVAIGVIALVVVLIAGLASVLWRKPQPTAPRQPTIQSQSSEQPDAYTAFRQKYGPWRTVANDTVSTDVAILKQNGTREDGGRTVPIDATWRQVVMTDFYATEKSGTIIRVETFQHATYALSGGQAFIIEGRPETLYGVTPTLDFVQQH